MSIFLCEFFEEGQIRARLDEYAIGWAAIKYRVPFITTLSAAEAIVRGLKFRSKKSQDYMCLQEFYQI